jgi:DNA-binding MarR family transcriptional regulator
MTLIGSRGDKGIWIKEHTLWKKTEMSILAYFSKHNNKSAKYREIARAYVSSSYSNFQKACEELTKRGYLEKLKDGCFKVRKESWEMVKNGKEVVERSLPYFHYYLKKLEKRKKI